MTALAIMLGALIGTLRLVREAGRMVERTIDGSPAGPYCRHHVGRLRPVALAPYDQEREGE